MRRDRGAVTGVEADVAKDVARSVVVFFGPDSMNIYCSVWWL